MLFFWPLRLAFFRLGLLVLVFSNSIGAALAQTDWKKDWERSVQEARRKDRSSSVFPPARSCESNWQRSSSQSSATTHANVE